MWLNENSANTCDAESLEGVNVDPDLSLSHTMTDKFQQDDTEVNRIYSLGVEH